MPKKKDDIDAVLTGDKPVPEVDEVELDYTDMEEAARVVPREGVDYRSVKYRSGGKGGQGLDPKDKSEAMSTVYLLTRVLTDVESQDIARRLVEEAEVSRKRAIERRRQRNLDETLTNWEINRIKKLEYLAKEFRSF
jgi:hypothetical protein